MINESKLRKMVLESLKILTALLLLPFAVSAALILLLSDLIFLPIALVIWFTQRIPIKKIYDDFHKDFRWGGR